MTDQNYQRADTKLRFFTASYADICSKNFCLGIWGKQTAEELIEEARNAVALLGEEANHIIDSELARVKHLRPTGQSDDKSRIPELASFEEMEQTITHHFATKHPVRDTTKFPAPGR